MAVRKGIFKIFSSEKKENRGFRIDSKNSIAALPTDVDFGVTVNNGSAIKITSFYAGLRIISENIASLPKQVKRETENGSITIKGDRISRLLNHPNPYTNKLTFYAVMTTWLKGWGNAKALIERDSDGNPIALHQVHPSQSLTKVISGKKWHKIQFDNLELQHLNGVYKDDDVIHVMDLSLDGIEGVNPVIYNAVSLGKSLALEKFAGEYFRKGGNIKAVMETDGNLGDDKYAAFMKHFADAATNFDTPLLEYGIKYKQLSVNPVAAQLLQSEVLSIQDVCRILGIPPHMVAELSHATFSNIEHQTIQFVQYTLRPIVKKFEVELENKLFPDTDEYAVKFSLDGLLRGDTATRSAYYHNAILDGYMSRNEVRGLEGLEHLDGLDDMLYPLNTGIVGKPLPEEK